MKKIMKVGKFIALGLVLFVSVVILAGCGGPQEYAVMGTSILAPKPGEVTTSDKKDIAKGLGAPLKVIEATASSLSDHKTGEAGKGEGPEYTIDGLSGTRWASAYLDNQWIQWKLDATHNLNAIIINWEIATARKFRILLSNDGNNWTEVYNGGTGGSGKKRYDFKTPVDAQYVKLDLMQRSTEWGFSIWEVYIYGK
jgi:hypothetical protein